MARLVKQVHITEDKIFLDGDEFPFFLEEQSPTIVNHVDHPDGWMRELVLRVLVDEDAQVFDERST